MKEATSSTYWVRIYIAGPIEVAKQVIRKQAKQQGMCVTIDPTDYIYSGGEEAGYVVQFISYPKFPKSQSDIWADALALANLLKDETGQDSYTMMDPLRTYWMTDRS